MMGHAVSYRSGLARIAVAGVVWGSIPLLSRQVDTSALVIVFWRVAFAFAAATIILLLRRRLSDVRRLTPRRLLGLSAMGVVLALNWVLFFSALQLTSVAVAVLLTYTGPVLVTALSPLVTREPFDARALAPLGFALAGTVVIVGPAGLALSGGTHLLGAALAFASAFTYSIGVVVAKRLLEGIPVPVYMAGETLAASVVLLPAMLLLPGPSTAVEWGSLATLGVVHTAGTGLLFLTGLRAVRADHAAILTYAEPVAAVLFAAAFLAEPLTLPTVAGGAMVVLGGVLVARMEPTPGIEAPVPVMEAHDV
jgi:drug/metabolite transporter (DMT)-like permease